MDGLPEPPEAAASRAGTGPRGITLTELTKVFTLGSKTVTALDRVNLDEPAGSFVTLLGPSGLSLIHI